MKKILVAMLFLLSFSANAYTLDDIKKQMLDQGFMIDYDAMKLNQNIMVAWKRGMSRYQCDLYVNTMLKDMNYPKVTQQNDSEQRIEMVVNNPGLVLGCANNTSLVWLVKS